MDGAAISFVEALAFSFIFGALTCLTTGTALAVMMPILSGLMLAASALALVDEITSLLTEPMCVGDRHYRLGNLLGSAIGGALGGGLGARLGRFCFTAGTLVQTQEGLKPIEDIKVGDKVLAAEPEKDEQDKGQWQEVVDTSVNEVSVVLDIRAGGETITVTPEHPFWVAGEGWLQAGHLECGQQLRTSSGKLLRIESVQRRTGNFKVYNFEVANAHTYFVGMSGVLVHNTCTVTKGSGPERVKDGYWVESDPVTLKPIMKTKKPNSQLTKAKDDIPDEFRQTPYLGESGKNFARRVLEEKGRYDPNDTGPGSLFNQIKKYADTHFEDPR